MTVSTPSRRFDLIAFDWDGTLFDSTQIIVRCIQAAVRDVGGTVPTDAAAAYVIGMALPQALAHAAPDVPLDQRNELGLRYRYHYLHHQDDIALFDGVLPLLHALREWGHLITVATGKSRRGLHRVLSGHKMLDYFDITRCADETRSKPDPLMLHEILKHCSAAPQQAIMVGDSPFDLRMANNANVPGVAVSYGAQPLSVLNQENPVLAIDRFSELTTWLQQQPNTLLKGARHE